MNAKRRDFLKAVVPAVLLAGPGLVGIGPVSAQSQHGQQTSNHPTNNPQRQSVAPPSQMPPPPLSPVPPTKEQLRQNERDIRKDVDQLFSLAQELKSLSEKNDASEELSVGLIAKTEEIEKLAKKIRDLARS